jgi:SAM-dependent methyltransferase
MWIVIGLVVLVILLSAAYGGLRAAIWVPMYERDVERVVAHSDIHAGCVFYDLGCGDGRVIEAAAARGARAIGYEVSVLPFILAYIRKLSSPYRKNITLRFGDFWFAQLSDADVVHVFLMEKVYPKLKQKIERECNSGTRVLVYVWPIVGWKADMVSDVEGSPKVYRYTV